MRSSAQNALMLGLVLATGSPVAANPAPTYCTSATFSFSVKFQSVVWVDVPDPTNKTAVLAFFFKAASFNGGPPVARIQDAEADVKVGGTFCAPESTHDFRSDVLQILIHTATYNRTVWAGLGYKDMYNYQLFAAANGYATLALDRPGNGEGVRFQRDHNDVLDGYYLDPTVDVQVSLHVEVIHGILELIKHANALGRTFGKFVLAGHSYGSVLVNALAKKYPNDVDILLLTSYSVRRAVVGALTADLESAADVYPDRYAGALPGYLTQRSESIRSEYMYSSLVDPAIPPLDYAGQGALTIGELLTTGQGLGVVPGFKGKVFIVTGEKDRLNCSPDLGVCSAFLEQTKALFPDACLADYYVIPNVGHTYMMHLSAQQTFGIIHEWLAVALTSA